MNKRFRIILIGWSFLLYQCNAKELVESEYSIVRSEEVYNGSFEIEKINKIRIVKSNQKSVYPLPGLNLVNGGKALSDKDFFSSLKKAFLDHDNKDLKLIQGGDTSFHILVEFKDGINACLHGKITRFGFVITPIFKGDSISRRNNQIYNVIYLAVHDVS